MLLFREVTMEVFDLHCDTLYKAMMKDSTIDSQEYEFRVKDLFSSSRWKQCMAVWTPDDVSELPKKFQDKPLIDYFIASAENLLGECKRLKIPFNDINADKSLMLTVENSSIIDNDITNIDILEKYGVKIATLTWNDRNCIGDGAMVENPVGATKFGKSVIREYIKRNIAIDTSHTSDALFYDIASENPKHILASHSNSRKICNHKRNLTDEQFCYIRDNGGIVGINLHKDFLKNDGNPEIKDILNHIYHFLSLGGEDVVALGTDFDGADITEEIPSSGYFYRLYNSLLENNFEKSVVDKIFYKNALEFYDKL